MSEWSRTEAAKIAVGSSAQDNIQSRVLGLPSAFVEVAEQASRNFRKVPEKGVELQAGCRAGFGNLHFEIDCQIDVHIRICIHIYIYIANTCTCTYIYTHVYMHIATWLHINMFIFMYVRIYLQR